MNLLGDDSDTECKFSINEHYAKKYDKWRQGEELQKLKDKYGNDCTSDSSSSEEDEDGIELTEDVEKDFFKTLSSLKEKNPKIYDKNVKFFDEKPGSKKDAKRKSGQFYSVGDHQRKMLLENGGRFSDDEGNKDVPLEQMTNVEQEKLIKNSFKKILENDSESDKEEEENDGWSSLFKKRIKTQEELKTEEADYKLWLAGEKKKLKNKEEESELKGLHDFWTDPKLDEGEQFLRDYILNKRFLEKKGNMGIPSYDEIVHDSDSGLSADETTIEKQEEFERKYNFRFEEPDHEFVKRFPRTLDQSMRVKDERRKKHREKVKERKEKEKAKKVEELKRLKALKKKEIMDRIKKLQEITGNEDLGFQSKDLEDDFDPDEHDKRMSELFNSEYYNTCNDDDRPEFPELDEELEIDNWDEWGESTNTQELHCEDPGFNMDCDYEPPPKNRLQNELINSSKKCKKRRQSMFAAAVAKGKPIFDPKDKTFDKYINEYYALDYEDLIGDLPCRFKYRKVVPNDFGLTVEEILAAPDKELNSWVSVKKIMQRRPENVELFDVQAYKKKGNNIRKKQKCLPSLFQSNDKDTDVTATNETTLVCTEKKSKSNLKNVQIDSGKKREREETHNDCQVQITDKGKQSKKLDRKKEKKQFNANKKSFGKGNSDTSTSMPYGISDTRLRSYGINPKKLKNKLKFNTEQ